MSHLIAAMSFLSTLLLLTSIIHTHARPASSNEIIYTPEALQDQITNLPGLAQQPTFNMFAGYLTVDIPSNRSIFYWYTESQRNPTSDPVIWWSNGGPGCSGLMGMLTENGPFRPASDGSGGLVPNPYSWNLLANTLFVEAPAGVGFSFSNNQSDYKVGDNRTATDNLIALNVFFQRFPHLATNTLYIASESYGGHYVPQLASLLVQDSSNFPTFSGFLLGNPFTDLIENLVYGHGQTLCGHSLAPEPYCAAFQQHCIANFSLLACPIPLVEVILSAGSLDRYGLDFPTCPASSRQRRQMVEGRRRFHSVFGSAKLPDETELAIMHPRAREIVTFVRALRQALNHLSPEHARRFKLATRESMPAPAPYDPCSEAEETVYLNRADVRAVLGVSPQAPPTWVSCTFYPLQYDFLDEFRFLEPVYQELIASGKLQMVIQSGDDDEVCATLGSQEWLYNTLAVKPNGGWRPWKYTSVEYGQQTGGYRVDFEGLTLVTVHTAGHMIPDYDPERGWAVYTSFLSGELNSLPTQAKEDL